MILHLLVVFLFLFMIVLLLRKHVEAYSIVSSPCIITMTTYMGFEDRMKNIPKILDKLTETNQEIVVINEWDIDASFYIDYMKQNYPKVKFIQKTKEDRGQARSLNILIRDYLLHSNKKYWIHWEDTWDCAKPLLPDLVRFMEKHPYISQLQITGDWKDMPANETTDLGEITVLIPQHQHQKDVYEMEQLTLETWPLFSLRPSINRLSFFQRHSNDFYFLEHPYLWPLRFEWEFGRIFLRNKGVKAITKKPYAERIKNHKSTYFKMFTAVPHLRE